MTDGWLSWIDAITKSNPLHCATLVHSTTRRLVCLGTCILLFFWSRTRYVNQVQMAFFLCCIHGTGLPAKEPDGSPISHVFEWRGLYQNFPPVAPWKVANHLNFVRPCSFATVVAWLELWCSLISTSASATSVLNPLLPIDVAWHLSIPALLTSTCI